MALPTNSKERKDIPLARGVLDYFPEALCEVAAVSLAGNKQHNLGPLRWDKSKSTDEADALMRHLIERGKRDTDGMRHSAKAAWRALAILQREIDAEREETTKREFWPIWQPEFTVDDATRVSDVRCYSCGYVIHALEDHLRCRGTA